MNCQNAIRQLSDYLDRELDSELKEQLRRHLAGCTDCRLIVDTTRKTIEIFCNTESFPLPQPVHDRLMRALAAKFASNK